MPDPTFTDFEQLRKLASGFQPAQIFLTALELGVFDALAGGEKDAAALGAAVGADPRATAIAADALAALGILLKSGGRYRNSEAAARFLVRGGPDYRGSILRHIRHGWGDWADFENAWRTGAARCARKEENIPADDAALADFILGMENLTRELALKIAELLPLENSRKVLDLGGGPGNYCLAFAARAPGARVFHFDLPRTSRIARDFVGTRPGGERVEFLQGDFTADDLGQNYDLVWASQVLHMLGEKDAADLVARAGASLAPGGVLAVHEHFLDDDKTSPLSAALFGAHMLAVTPCGRAYSFAEIEAWMRAAGLAPEKRIDYGGASRILLGRKRTP